MSAIFPEKNPMLTVTSYIFIILDNVDTQMRIALIFDNKCPASNNNINIMTVCRQFAAADNPTGPGVRPC